MLQLFGKAAVEKTTELIVVDYMGRSDMGNMQSLKKNWQGLSRKACDVEEEVNREEMSGKKKRKREVDGWLKDVKKLSSEIDELETKGSSWRLPLKEDPVGKLQRQVKDLVDQSRHFDGLVLDTCDNIGEPCLPTKLFGVKFDEALKRIWPCLVTDNISSIGIHGMGGVGKTTLAKHIKYYLSENTNYRVLWITVSQEFSITNLQDKIANVLGIRLSNGDEEEVRADILRGAFSNMERLVVLILDDVWVEFCLDRVGIPLHPNKCRLILTTRSLEVCDRMQCQRKFDLQTLDKDEAWDLFKYRLGTETLLQGDLENIAESIVEECGGLPLGIITVAGSMRGVRDICEWRNALEQLKTCSIGYHEMERDVFPILEWSFNRLDKYERNCFLYCCLYPEDSDIKRKELIDLFIWAELMSKRDSRSKEFDQGQMILNKLIKVCLLEETKDFGGDDCVKMHDLVRDMALRIANGNSKLEMSRDDVPRFLVKSLGQGDSKVTLEQEEWTQDLRAISLYSQNFEEIEIPPAWSPSCPKLSTLLLSWVVIVEIPDSFFRHMCGLKVLNLSNSGITELPNSVSDLVNLAALILRGCEHLQSVPPLGKLKQLRELELSDTEIQDLPQGLDSLVNLEGLDLDYCLSLEGTIIPKGTFSELHRLQRLKLPRLGTVQINDPEVLNGLESFVGCLCFTDFYKISRWPEHYYLYISENFSPFYDDDAGYAFRDRKELWLEGCDLGRGPNLPVLYLPSDLKYLRLQKCVGQGVRCLSDAFENLTTLNDLSSLRIEGLNGIRFLWQLSSPAPRDQQVDSSFSPFMEKLQTLELEDLPDLVRPIFGESEAYLLPPGTFSSLTDLSISKCHSMKQLSSFSPSFGNLQWLRLKDLQNLVGPLFGESEAYLLPLRTFSSLSYLSISKCHNMKQLFTVQLLQNLENLITFDVFNCEGLEEIVADDNAVGQGGGEGIQLTSSEATTTVILPKLKWLNLDSLPQLNSICQAAMRCDSIHEIKIIGCPNVKRLPLFLPPINGHPLFPALFVKSREIKNGGNR